MAAPDGAVRGRVLLVEDEDLLRWSIERYLAKRGFAVDAVRTAPRPWRCSSARPTTSSSPTWRSPASTGWRSPRRRGACTPRRRSSSSPARAPRTRSCRRCARAFADYIEKPFDLELLLLTVEKALEKTLILRELIQLARTDGLTGLYNQRHFYSVLEAEINRARRQSRALSLLLVDVDDFKRYNDRFGHLAGDAALARIAACLKKACRRDIDTAFRYGGDEFILVLPEADRATAAGIAARVRSLLVDEGIALTVSIGVAELREGQDLKDFIREADRAMYRDKSGDAPARCLTPADVELAAERHRAPGAPCLPAGYSLQSRPCPRTTTSRTRIPSRRRSRASGAPRSGARSSSPRSRR